MQPPATTTGPTPDPFLIDQDALRDLAADRIIARGVAYREDNRVMLVSRDGDRLTADVEGSEREPYTVVIEAVGEQELLFSCTCPFDYGPVCKHAVAALLQHFANSVDTSVADAAAQALADRRRRAVTEVRVEALSGGGGPGTWTARSVKGSGRRYEVQLRSVDESINSCTCPDFALNTLGTCKHIEAVLHRIRKRRRRGSKTTRASAQVAVVHLAWQGGEQATVRLHRPADMDATAERWLNLHFRVDGSLRGAMPDAIFALERDVAELDTVLIGAEVRALAERLMADRMAAHAGEELARNIGRHGGQIPGLKTHLHPYQVQGVAFLASRGRALLADDMGLGKTLQAIGACSVLMDEAGVERVLVVCPASLKSQWSKEIQRFTGRRVQVVEGPVRRRLAQYRNRAAFTIVNYELVLRDHEVIDRELLADVLVVDEAQRIRNWKTRTADAVKALHSRYAFVLTGTPLENRLLDLYSVMQVIDGRVLGPLWRFMVDFHVTDDKGKVLGYRNLSELRRRLAPVMLRRNRTVVADQLPERVVQRRDVPLSQRQEQIQNGALMTVQTIQQEAKRQKRPLTPGEENLVMAALQNARMACNAAGLVDKETVGSPKLTELAALLQELCVEGDHKVVLFSQWERMTVMVEKVIDELGLGYVRLHGGVPTRHRGGLIERFENDPSVRVFLSTDAGATGLNLQAASALINLDLPWNPALLDQRIGRVHRLGQRRTCLIVLLVSAPSYEERVWEILSGKRHLFSAVVSGEVNDDAVGLSQRSIELAMAAAQLPEPGHPATEPTAQLEDDGTALEVPDGAIEPATAEEAAPDRGQTPTDEGESRAPLVARLQELLGERLERVMVSGDGLLAVARDLDEQAWALAEELSTVALPVVLIDPRSWLGLQRMPGGLAADAEEVFNRDSQPAPQAEHPLRGAARRKVDAAAVLIDSGCEIEAMGLLADAMLAAIAARAGRKEAPETGAAAAWLYGEAVVAGFVPAEDAGLVLRADALHRGGQVPGPLAAEALVDARRIVLAAP